MSHDHGGTRGDPTAPGTSRLPEASLAHGEPAAPGEAWKVALGWLVVGIPAAWGVSQVVVKSLALFR